MFLCKLLVSEQFVQCSSLPLLELFGVKESAKEAIPSLICFANRCSSDIVLISESSYVFFAHAQKTMLAVVRQVISAGKILFSTVQLHLARRKLPLLSPLTYIPMTDTQLQRKSMYLFSRTYLYIIALS